jgi:pSer/pThr/pTyr-binding forkhead associated (FHA) protein
MMSETTGDRELERGWRLIGVEDPTIVCIFGETQLRRAYPGLTIGRHPGLADLVIDDPSVSRRHARLGRDGDLLYLEDLNSLNGTLIDGETAAPFDPRPVRAGQVIELGGVALVLRAVTDARA